VVGCSELDTEQLPPIGRLKMTASLRGSCLSVGTEPVSKPGAGWAGLLGRGGGLRPGKLLLLFFSCLILFSFYVFCFEFSN
jgi:hypothetical protein